ncbi:MAG: hypothetical protein KFB97_10155 [Cyanobium sp. M30B3]|jgi:hypothetical protein|nr:MAG: hypothetical protein KFB97_10155 [Cyanobium sp. M30B3]
MPNPRLLSLLLASVLGMLPLAGRGQDLVGCSLVDGQLSCVPGVSADPQAQIRALRGQIGATLAQESAVQQQIDGLQNLVLSGEALEGSLLQASLEADQLANLPPTAFHWYRLSPGGSHWIWIESAQGPSYRLSALDLGSQVMLVVVGDDGPGARRQATPPVGPVRPGP